MPNINTPIKKYYNPNRSNLNVSSKSSQPSLLNQTIKIFSPRRPSIITAATDTIRNTRTDNKTHKP